MATVSQARLTRPAIHEKLGKLPADSRFFLLSGPRWEDRLAMKNLTSALLGRACRIYLRLAYPEGEQTIPASRRAYLHISADLPLESLLKPPVFQVVRASEGDTSDRYSFRLGSSVYPNLKLQVTDCDRQGTLVFLVDTHDAALQLDACHPDYARCLQVQGANRLLKEQVERAWEEEGLMTFNGLLKQQLDRC